MVNNGVITAPLSLNDVKRTIGESTKDLGSLCSSDKINMWAKYKPVGKSGFDFSAQMNDNLTWKDTANWWKGTDSSCGLNIPQSQASGIPEQADMIDWATHFNEYIYSYKAPSGGTNEPYRLVDFVEYDHNAQAPTTASDTPEKVTDNGTLANPRFTYTFTISFNHNANWLRLHDIAVRDSNGNILDLSSWYVGAILVSKDNTKAYIATSNSTLDDSQNVCLCTIGSNEDSFYTTQWTLYPLLASVTTNGALVNSGYGGKVITMPTIGSSIIKASKFSDEYSLEINTASLSSNVLSLNYNATAPDLTTSFNGTFTMFACSQNGQPYDPTKMYSVDTTVQVGNGRTYTDSNISSTVLSNLGYGQVGGEYLRIYFNATIGSQEIISNEMNITVS